MKLSMKDKDFLHYWLYAAFPSCLGIQRYFSANPPCTHRHQQAQYNVVAAGKKITIWMYRHHIEYRIGERALYQPCLSYDVVKELDSDMYLLLLPIVDMATCDYRSERVLPDLKRNLSETALPAAHVEEVAYDICCGLVDGNGAEDEPLWMIWDETEERRYGAFWWQDAQELQLFTEDEDIPSEYITAPQGEESCSCARTQEGNGQPEQPAPSTCVEDEALYDWAKKKLSEWILTFV